MLGRFGVAGDELPHQHLVQCSRVLGRGPRLQPAEGGRTGQRLGTAHGRLHHQVLAQRVVVAHVRPAQAQTIDALRQQAVHAGAAALVTQRPRRSAGQTKTVIDPLEQQHATIANDVATIERSLHHAPSNPSELDGPIGTLWHRQSSVAIGGEIPMTTGSATRLPTYCS